MKNIWQQFQKPIKVLAPMAGYTDSAFRRICKEFGADLVISELISADAIYYKAKNWIRNEKGEWQSKKGERDDTLELLKFCDNERPLIIQLFGKYPEKFAFAADWITKNLKPDGIDINMGCPARKVVGSDHGAALIKYPKLAAEIVKAVKDNTNLPVSVKTRLGWDKQDQILEFTPVLAKAGIDAIIVHGRTYKQGFAGEAEWENIYKIKTLLPDLIVIGNGGVKSVKEGNAKILFTPNTKRCSLDGFAIGQAAFGKPWIFSEAQLSQDELKKLILKHARLSFETKGEFGIIEFRKHLLKYLAGFPDAKSYRKQAVAITNIDQISKLIKPL